VQHSALINYSISTIQTTKKTLHNKGKHTHTHTHTHTHIYIYIRDKSDIYMRKTKQGSLSR